MRRSFHLPLLVRGAATALVLAAALPCAARVARAAEVTPVILQTSDVDVDHNYGVAEGSLRLTIGAGGEILGYYRAVDEGRLLDVHGSLTNSKIYLYIGDRVITGTYMNGKLDGYTLEEARVHHFTGVAEPTARS